MTERVEYGSKAAADAARDRHSEYLCSVDDDRRLKTVAYSSDTPDSVLDTERLEAADGRSEGGDGPGQVPLSDAERGRIDFSKGRANIPHAKAVKGIAQAEGVEDWLAYYDPTLTVDEHREVMARAGRESGQHGGEETADEKAGRAARAAQSNQCDHARGHCLNGDPEACEFLQTTCQMSLDEVMNDVLARHEPERRPEPKQPDAPPDNRDPTKLTGKQKGALQRSWNGYQAAVVEVEEALTQLANSWTQAQQAARAINAIRGTVGQTPLHFERLEKEQAGLLDLSREMAADCVECHADHSGHGHDVTHGTRETLPDAVVNGAAETPVGTSDETDAAADRNDVMQVEQSAQADLSGDRTQQDQQAELAVESDTRQAQGRESRHESEQNTGGLMADTRADPSQGPAQSSDSSDQQTFRDPDQGQL